MPIDALPDEVLVEIIRFLTDYRFERNICWPRESQSLRSCCLVSRRWQQLAQPLLFENVSLRSYEELEQYHSSLTTSKHLGRYVLNWEMRLTSCGLGCSDPGMASRLMADCLKKTTRLQKTSLRLSPNLLTPSMTELVFRGICQLQKLEYLVIDYLNDFDESDDSEVSDVASDGFHGPNGSDGLDGSDGIDGIDGFDGFDGSDGSDGSDGPDGFDGSDGSDGLDGFDGFDDGSDIFHAHADSNSVYLVLLDLPKTIKTLRIGRPTDNLVQLLPKICANLSIPQITPTGSNTEKAGLAIHAQNQAHHITGLSCLQIEDSGLPIISPALGLALASTLTTFQYSHDPDSPPLAESVLINFLAETPLLEHLYLRVRISLVFFDDLLPLTQLRSLEVQLLPISAPADQDDVCRPLAHFLSHSPHFHTVRARLGYDDSSLSSQFIEALLASTSLDGSLSRLRQLELYSSSAPSIDTFERMCRAATMLRVIRVSLPIAPLSRVAGALANLQHLVRGTLGSTNSWCNMHISLERLNGDGPIDFFSKLSKTGWLKNFSHNKNHRKSI